MRIASGNGRHFLLSHGMSVSMDTPGCLFGGKEPGKAPASKKERNRDG